MLYTWPCAEEFSPLKIAPDTTDDPETSRRDLLVLHCWFLGRLMGFFFFFFFFFRVPLTFTSGFRTPCSTSFTIYFTSEIILMVVHLEAELLP
jgi:hypothetical protein